MDFRDYNRTNELIAFRNGESKGFDYFFNTYYKAVYLFAFKYVKECVVAEDIIDNSFIKLWDKRLQMESEIGLRSYLYKTVYHGCLRWLEDQKRKNKVYKTYNLSFVAVEDGHIENMIKAETLRFVKEGIEKLPTECRKVFIKLFVEGKSVSETAFELNVAASTVKNQKARGIKLLRTRLTFILVIVGNCVMGYLS